MNKVNYDGCGTWPVHPTVIPGPEGQTSSPAGAVKSYFCAVGQLMSNIKIKMLSLVIISIF